MADFMKILQQAQEMQGKFQKLQEDLQQQTVRASADAAAPPTRLTDEMVRSERLAALRRRDPVLGAAIDALDLDLVD